MELISDKVAIYLDEYPEINFLRLFRSKQKTLEKEVRFYKKKSDSVPFICKKKYPMLLNLLFDFLNQNVMTMSERIIFNTISIVIL